MASKRLTSYIHRLVARVDQDYVVPGNRTIPRTSINLFALVRDAMRRRWPKEMLANVPVITQGKTRVYKKPLHNGCTFVQEIYDDSCYSYINFEDKQGCKNLLLELLSPPHNFCI